MKLSIKASFKLTVFTKTDTPNIKTSRHLFDHFLKPIVLYGFEIWRTFKKLLLHARKQAVLHLRKFIKIILQTGPTLNI